MFKKQLMTFVLCITALSGALMVSGSCSAQSAAHIYELRTYTSHEGRLGDVVNRFRDHTMRIFEKHGMVSVGYWIPKETPNTLIYVLSHPNREAATRNRDEFRNDPEWKTARAASEANGPIVLKTQSVFMEPTAFSPLK